MKKKGTGNLTLTQRRSLEALLQAGVHKKQIAKQLGICLATVYNEIKRGECTVKKYSYTDYWGDKHYKYVKSYSADIAEGKYRVNQTSHGAPLKIGNDYAFVRYMEEQVVKKKLSPCAVLGRIKRENLPFKTRISKTTLYRYIRMGIFMNITMDNVQLKRKHYEKATVKRSPKGTSIEKRPVEIVERSTFGHWEMDCVIGKKYTRDTLLTFTERLTRYEIVMRMPNRKAATVIKFVNKLERRFGKDFRKVFKSITVDNGGEFADFVGLERSIYGGQRTNVYYCHPYSSYERGSNERLNREIRRLLPKGTDFTIYTDAQIKQVETWVNDYPREIFNFATSAEMFEKELQAI